MSEPIEEPKSPAEQPATPPDEHTPDDPGYSYDDVHKPTVRDIAEESPEEKPEGQKPPVSDPEPKKEEATPEPEPKIDPAKLAEDAAQKALEAVEAKQKAEAEAKANQPKTPEEEYRDIASDFEKKEGRPPTWEELAVKMEERTLAKLEAKQAEKERITQETQQREQQEAQTNQQQLNTYIDSQLDLMYKNKMLTPIADKNNPADQGVIERKSLFSKMAEINNERRAKNLPLVASPLEVALSGWERPSTNQVPGQDAPIAGNQGSATPPGTEQDYSYNDLKRPWSFFRRK